MPVLYRLAERGSTAIQEKGTSMPTHRQPIPTYPDLAGKVAVVTGGSRGIGAATYRLLAASGAQP